MAILDVSNRTPPVDGYSLENFLAKFYPDPIRNDRALGLFDEGRPNQHGETQDEDKNNMRCGISSGQKESMTYLSAKSQRWNLDLSGEKTRSLLGHNHISYIPEYKHGVRAKRVRSGSR